MTALFGTIAANAPGDQARSTRCPAYDPPASTDMQEGASLPRMDGECAKDGPRMRHGWPAVGYRRRPAFRCVRGQFPRANFVETTRPGTAAAKNASARPVSGAQHREPLALVPGQGFRGHSRLHDHSIDLGEGRDHVWRRGIQLFG